jgi:tellurite methyltransferase
MSADDESRWNAKWSNGYGRAEPSASMLGLADYLPDSGRALDVAGGAGRHAIWLAEHGFETTLTDVSSVAITLAQGRAAEKGFTIAGVQGDLEIALPAGPWDVVLIHQYLQRDLISAFAGELSEAGRLVMVHPTVRNLERHTKPSARFLLDEAELAGLAAAAEMRVLWCWEGWTTAGHHEAHLVAARA